ncbi:MAG TPA: hypothetical protein PLW65_30060, partial [Pseudomonadota bacterium]|nr:hypothetical protein [Pseudomonadota bacterium]
CGVIFAKFHAAQEQKRRLEVEREAQAKAAAEAMAAKEAKAALKAVARAERQAAEAKAESRTATLLSTCPVCGGAVAIGAKACPHCGKDNPAPPPKKPASRLKLVGAAFFVVFLIYSMSQGSNPGGSSTPPPPITAEGKQAAQLAIKLAGYRCDSVSYMGRHVFKVGFRVTCNDDRYAYELNDEGGRWVVKLD